MRARKPSPLILGLLAVGLGVRLLWVAVHPVEPISDFSEYHKHAATILHGYYSDTPGVSSAYWPPGWPAMLAALYAVFGVHARLGAFLGATLDWGAVALAAVAACRLLRPRFAAGAVAAMCFYPGAIAFAPVLGTEHPAALLFTGLVLLLAFYRPSPRTALGAGLLAGALLLVRADYGVAGAAVTAVWLLRQAPRGRPVLAAVTVAGALVFLGPWIVRCAVTFGEFVPTSANGGVNFYLGTLAPGYTESPEIARVGASSTRHPAARDRYWLRRGVENVADDPLRWIGLDVRRIYYQYKGETDLVDYGEVYRPAVRRAASVYWWAIVALAVVGFGALIATRGRVSPACTVIAASIAVASVLKLAFAVNQRERLTLTYLLILVAAFGVQYTTSLLMRRTV